MKITTTNIPDVAANEIIDKGLDDHAEAYSQMTCEALCVYCRDESGTLIGGLFGDTGGGWLHVFQVWVSEEYRLKSLGSEILAAAEEEAVARGCHGSNLETYSFQAVDFYLSQGYQEFGVLEGYDGNFSRHFLSKKLSDRAVDAS